MSDTPKCDKCGLECTTGMMVAFCNQADQCEFWPHTDNTNHVTGPDYGPELFMAKAWIHNACDQIGLQIEDRQRLERELAAKDAQIAEQVRVDGQRIAQRDAQIAALREDIERHIAIASEHATENTALREALDDIENETRDGGQWNSREINEVARIALAGRPSDLHEAANAIYEAGYWICDRPVDAAALWTALRDALGRPPGTSPKPLKSVNGSIHEAGYVHELEERAKEARDAIQYFLEAIDEQERREDLKGDLQMHTRNKRVALEDAAYGITEILTEPSVAVAANPLTDSRDGFTRDQHTHRMMQIVEELEGVGIPKNFRGTLLGALEESYRLAQLPGWKLVPLEPMADMGMRVREQMGTPPWSEDQAAALEYIEDAYRHMVEVAPSPSTETPERVNSEPICTCGSDCTPGAFHKWDCPSLKTRA